MAFFAIEVAGDYVQGYGLMIDSMWRYILTVSLSAYIMIRFLHKHTGMLKNP